MPGARVKEKVIPYSIAQPVPRKYAAMQCTASRKRLLYSIAQLCAKEECRNAVHDYMEDI